MLSQLVLHSSEGSYIPSLLILERMKNTIKHHSLDFIWEHSSQDLAKIRAIGYA